MAIIFNIGWVVALHCFEIAVGIPSLTKQVLGTLRNGKNLATISIRFDFSGL